MRDILKALLLLSLLLVSACATRKEVVNFKQDAVYLRAQVDSLRAEQRRLWLALQKLAALTEQSTESTNRLRADVQLQLNQMAEQTQLLSDRLEDTGRRISNLPAKLRLAAAPVAASTPDTTSRAGSADTSRADFRRRLEEAQRLYDSAYQDLVKGQYQLAIQGFTQFLQMAPESDLADNAQYWIGECYYAQRQFREAIPAFETVVAKYPDGDKVPAAMLKLAYSQIAIGQTTEGKKNLNTLIQRFPQTNEANLARSRLQDLPR
jgi:tol-pal system protein YbgF